MKGDFSLRDTSSEAVAPEFIRSMHNWNAKLETYTNLPTMVSVLLAFDLHTDADTIYARDGCGIRCQGKIFSLALRRPPHRSHQP